MFRYVGVILAMVVLFSLIVLALPAYSEEAVCETFTITSVLTEDGLAQVKSNGGQVVTARDEEADAVMAVIVEMAGPPPGDFKYDRVDLVKPSEDADYVKVAVSYNDCVKGTVTLPLEPFAKLFQRA